ncbi:MAG: DEAD/DEAH box helicase family protein [Candidatus Poribacteria bacterium]|nr:DEAD/DEAH box helicase family protein [Candidatus Poribacteria bacterium]
MNAHLSNLQKVFGSGGLIARHLSGYEFRPQQLQMAEAVADALQSDEHLIVEAGTGVGKSFAYLLPAIELALETQQPVVISTHTISLQEQLIHKDIPFLQTVLPKPFTAVLAKGRGNYLSRRRLNSLFTYDRGLFETRAEVQELARIVEWVNVTQDGSKADIEPQPMPEIWSKVASDTDNCLRHKCPTYHSCFYFKARAQMNEADLIIVNHHLLFTDWALRKTNPYAAILPEYKHLILDEAHHLEGIATEHASVEFSNARVKWFLDSLCNPQGKGGLFIRFQAEHSIRLVEDARYYANLLFASILSRLEEMGAKDWGHGITQRVDSADFVDNVLDIPLGNLQSRLKNMKDAAKTDDDLQEIDAHLRRCRQLRNDLDMMLSHTKPDYVYWAEISTRRRSTRIVLNATPVNVSQELKDHLFEKVDSVIMTSATLATNRNFNYFKQRVGLTDCRELIAGSPFNYLEQVEIHIPAQMPEPNNSIAFTQSAITQIKNYLKMTHGKAFVLFTSYRMMDEVYEAVQPYLEQLGIASFKQGDGLSRSAMLAEFRQDTNSVLFGTSSFWEGVDVQGESLSNVIITRLPFEVPTHPVIEARVKQIEDSGGNPFMDFSLPEAIIRFKQGFGRLIRTKTDRGIAVILDARIKTKFYGKQFLNSLPQCKIIDGA